MINSINGTIAVILEYYFTTVHLEILKYTEFEKCFKHKLLYTPQVLEQGTDEN